jgi:hypothetical protein
VLDRLARRSDHDDHEARGGEWRQPSRDSIEPRQDQPQRTQDFQVAIPRMNGPGRYPVVISRPSSSVSRPRGEPNARSRGFIDTSNGACQNWRVM